MSNNRFLLKPRIALIVILALGFGIVLLSIEVAQRNVLTLDNELISPVSDLTIRKDGTVWVATDRGVSKFDGKQWTTVISNTAFLGIEASPDNTIWVYTSTQVRHFDGTIWQTYAPHLGSSNSKITDLKIALDGKVWVSFIDDDSNYTGIASGVTNLPENERYTLASSIPMGRGRLLGIDAAGHPWITYYRGSAYLDKGQWVATNDWIENARFAPNGSRWAVMWGYWDKMSGSAGNHTSWVETTVAICYQQTEATQDCYLFAEPTKKYPDPDWSKEQVGISGIATTRETQVFTTTALLGRDVKAWDLAPNGDLWLATDKQELVHFDETTWDTYPLKQIERDVKKIDVAPDGSVWVITSQGVGQIRIPSP